GDSMRSLMRTGGAFFKPTRVAASAAAARRWASSHGFVRRRMLLTESALKARRSARSADAVSQRRPSGGIQLSGVAGGAVGARRGDGENGRRGAGELGGV